MSQGSGSGPSDSLWVDSLLEVPIEPYLPDTEVAVQDIRRLYSNILEMDHQVGLILDQLEEDGLLDKTIIFWYSDHGGPLPRQKRTVYDSGIRVPMVIRFPQKQFAGLRDSQLISFIDFKPTLLSLAGVPPPDNLDGRAFIGKYRSNTPHKYIFAAADRFDHETDRIRAARDHRYKYIRNYFPEQPYYLPVRYREEMAIMQELLRLDSLGQLNEYQRQWFRPTKDPEELFDTWNDPHELHNLANDTQYQGKLNELRDAMDNWIANTGDKGLIPEGEYIAQRGSYWEEPQVASPLLSLKSDGWHITSTTEGAAIGYQWVSDTANVDEYWKIYREPLPDNENMILVARADRIGWKPSEVVFSR